MRQLVSRDPSLLRGERSTALALRVAANETPTSLW